MTTQITDSMTKAMQALAAMETNAARVSEVAARLLAADPSLPELLEVRPHAKANKAQLDLQPSTVAAAHQWADALGIELTVEDSKKPSVGGWMYRRSSGRREIDGVTVFVVSSQAYNRREWAELMAAKQVAA